MAPFSVMPQPSVRSRRAPRLVAVLLATAVLATACGGTKSDDSAGSDGGGGSTPAGWERPENGVETGLADAGEPVRGGRLVYAVEAESTAGYCLSEAQLAISGMMVVRAFYDTLTVPNADGEYVPYLAEDVQPNDDYTQWTITLREGVKFHDGSDLTAEVVRNNLDAYRGVVGSSTAETVTPHPTREPLLFLFVMDNIDNVEVTGDLEVTVTTKVPWVAFNAFLYSSGRLGITAQAQLDAALAGLDLLVAVDLVQRESHRHAHWLIPGTHWLEREELSPLLANVQERPFVQYAQRAVSPPDGVMEEWEFFTELALAMGRNLFGRRGVNRVIRATRWVAARTGRRALALNPEWVSRLLVALDVEH